MISNRLSIVLVLSCFTTSLAAERPLPAIVATNNVLTYNAAANGDRVPDFSYCGYWAGAQSPPWVETRVTLAPSGGDDTQQIQDAIDRLAATAGDQRDWRGAVQLAPGQFQVSGSLQLHGEGIVLRGSGSGSTTIIATGHTRRTLIVVGVKKLPNGTSQSADKHPVATRICEYVPVGAMSVKVEQPALLSLGQRVRIEHPSTPEWIEAVGMNTFPSDDGKGSWLDWKPGSIDQNWERTIVAIDGNDIKLDAPITSSIDPKLTSASVNVIAGEARAKNVGVENLTLISLANTEQNPKDEEHAWDAVQLNHVEDAWVRSVTCRQFVGSAVHVGAKAFRVTIADCKSLDPISEDAGWRRHSFYTLGQQILFLRCEAVNGRHDFAVGPLTPGPNAFVYCSSKQASRFSGPIGSWASGVLYDNVEIDGAGLSLTNRETVAQGTGWAAANCVLWNCVAPVITCRKPPTANNWAFGVWGEYAGDGTWHEMNSFISPDSLYGAQLAARIGTEPAKRALQAKEWLKELSSSNATPYLNRPAIEAASKPAESNRLSVIDGRLAIGDRLAVGKRLKQSWWRGSVLPAKVAEFGPSLARYVPGRGERYYTDEISDVVRQMKANGHVALEHHWGLWYDRRRDDHQLLRRIDGDAWPPFYELPWARSGMGQAWDGLSRYDLTRFNSWYFDRLSAFAEQADMNGLVLMHYMYFQHNILEAGAHWADFPWRPANCIQDTGFSEPPTYENRKRVFMADDFYDVAHPVRRDLHTAYIRHCLDTLGQHSNVLFVLGEEFTGPTHFVRFWLDTIRSWQVEKGRDVLVVLSATRDVQTAVLADPTYASLVDVIDLKYWWYTKDGSVYDPPGGNNLAPRQQYREWKESKSPTAESLSRGISEMRQLFPEKAVVCSVAGCDPGLVLAAGGSLPEFPKEANETSFLKVLNR